MAEANIYVQISILYCMVHMYIFLFLFYEYRCSKKVFFISAISIFIVTSAICIYIMFTQGITAMGQQGLFIAAIPTLLFFLFMSRQRNAHFVFIFCFSDTVCIWIELSSGLIDYALGGSGIVTLILRLISFPLLEYAVWRWIRQPFLEISHLIHRGWLLFAALTSICYIILVLLSIYPTIIFERPNDIPLATMVLILIALAYCTIFMVLFEQLNILKAQERQQVLKTQTLMMSRQVKDMRRAEEAMRIERHDMRHQLQTVLLLAQRGDYSTLLDYLNKSQAKLSSVLSKSYCTNPILDAILVNITEQAEQMNIRMEMNIVLPEKLPVDVLELSIVFANALENAIQAVKDLPAEQRCIICKSVIKPRFMLEISNPYSGEIRFNQQGFPITDNPGHGIGTRSIAAFAEKHNALCLFRAENGWFKLQIAM